jgi:hypothetical protein
MTMARAALQICNLLRSFVAPLQQGSQGPPQSTPASLPFFFPSVQEGAWHWPLMQTSLSQSEGHTQP